MKYFLSILLLISLTASSQITVDNIDTIVYRKFHLSKGEEMIVPKNTFVSGIIRPKLKTPYTIDLIAKDAKGKRIDFLDSYNHLIPIETIKAVYDCDVVLEKYILKSDQRPVILRSVDFGVNKDSSMEWNSACLQKAIDSCLKLPNAFVTFPSYPLGLPIKNIFVDWTKPSVKNVGREYSFYFDADFWLFGIIAGEKQNAIARAF